MRKTKVDRFDRRAIGGRPQAKLLYEVDVVDPLTTRATALAETANAIFESLPELPNREVAAIDPLIGYIIIDWFDLLRTGKSYRLSAARDIENLLRDCYFNIGNLSMSAALQQSFGKLSGHYLEAVYTLNERAEAVLTVEQLSSHRLRMEELQADFDKLEQGLKRVTPVHDALQRHLQILVASLGRWRSPEAEKRFFEPLIELRDQYFAAEELRLIDEYLRRSSPKAGGVEYAVAYGGHSGERLELAAEELELAAMLESLTQTVAATHG